MKLMFYFLLALTAIFAATANAGGPVLDADGDIIFNGSYYVLPLVWGPAGGGLTLTSGDYKKCPLYIGQDSSEVNMGIPIKFSNWKSKVGFVPESESLSIEMDTKATICGQSTYWWVAAPDMPKMLFVTAGPNPKEHVEDSRRSFFQIKKAEDFRIGYKIVFCPQDNYCMDVGIHEDTEACLQCIEKATANAGGPVLDTDGDFILDGGSYYVLPIFSGGGLTLTPRGGNQCPLHIGQEYSDVNKGIPVKFSNCRSKFGFVLESVNLNIEMDVKATICFQSTYWWVDECDMAIKKFFIMSGPKPKPGEDSSKSFFQIKKTKYFHNGYTIAFCPNDNDCIDVGIFVDEYGVWRLALSPTPFPVMFVKAIGTETSSKTMYERN